MDTFVHIVYSSPEFLILFAYTVHSFFKCLYSYILFFFFIFN